MPIKLFLITLPVFLAIDMLWLGIIAKNFYAKQIGFLLKPNVNWTAAILFYLIFNIGLVLFVLQPALENKSLSHAILYGALFGFVTYATYDLTNLATIESWPILVTIIDLIWGTFLATSVSLISFTIAKGLGL